MFSARCLCSGKRRKRINGGKWSKAAHIISKINRMHFLGIRFLFVEKVFSDAAMLYCSVLTMIVSYR